MSVQINTMFKGFNINELDAIKQAHQTYYEVMKGCYLDDCCEPEVFKQFIKAYIDRHDEVQIMLQGMIDSIYYDEADLGYSISVNDWTLMKSDMMLACVDQYEVWSSLVDDATNKDDKYEMLARIFNLNKAIDKLNQTW